MKVKNICLIHGWGANAQKLKPLERELQKLGWQVFLPELPFFDLPEPQEPWKLGDFANFIGDSAQKFFQNKPYTLFGHSLGGRIALKMGAEDWPRLNSIVLCAAAGISRANPFKRLLFRLVSKILAPLEKISPSFFLIIKRGAYRLAKAYDYEQITSETKKETFKNIIEENLKLSIPRIKIPVLILWGGKDKTTPVNDARFLHKNIVGSNLEIFPNETHRLPYNQPKALALKIDHWFTSL